MNIFKARDVVGNRIKSPYFNNRILIVTSYFTDNNWKFKFENERDVIGDEKSYWASTPYSYFEKNNLVITRKNEEENV